PPAVIWASRGSGRRIRAAVGRLERKRRTPPGARRDPGGRNVLGRDAARRRLRFVRHVGFRRLLVISATGVGLVIGVRRATAVVLLATAAVGPPGAVLLATAAVGPPGAVRDRK